MGKIIAVRVGEEPTVEDMSVSYENIRAFVDGYIECLRITDRICLWLNEEGKLIGLEPNIILLLNGKPYDYVCGNAFFCSVNDSGDSVGLSDEEIEIINDRLRVGMSDGKPIMAIEMS